MAERKEGIMNMALKVSSLVGSTSRMAEAAIINKAGKDTPWGRGALAANTFEHSAVYCAHAKRFSDICPLELLISLLSFELEYRPRKPSQSLLSSLVCKSLPRPWIGGGTESEKDRYLLFTGSISSTE